MCEAQRIYGKRLQGFIQRLEMFLLGRQFSNRVLIDVERLICDGSFAAPRVKLTSDACLSVVAICERGRAWSDWSPR